MKFTSAGCPPGGDRATKVAEWAARSVGFVRIRANEATGGHANMGGLRIGGRTAKPTLGSKTLPGDGTVHRPSPTPAMATTRSRVWAAASC
jgi:hypothetical protein